MHKHSLPRRLLSYALMLSLLAATVAIENGCRHVNSSNPAVISAVTLNNAAKACQTVATGLADADAVLDKIQAQEPDYYAHAKPLLQRIAKANDTAIVAVSAALAGDAKVDWRSAMLAVSTAVASSDLTTFGFKNPQTQQLVQVGFATLISILSTIPATFGGKP